ncbi:MAG: dehydrogenase [Zetaproteobacteria bacterium]|nr:dehydrogenase [Pseudobdellovibrionaceae bacterium]
MARQMERVCSLCEAMCGLIIEKSGDKVLSIKGNPADVFSSGSYCPKSQGLKDLYEDPDRLKQPLKKTKAGFITVPWEQAFEEIVEKIQKVQKNHGKSSVASYVGNPNVHNYANTFAVPLFLRSLGTKNRFSATSVDQLPHMLVAQLMFGHQFLIPIADVDRTDYMLILGANPVVSNGSLLSAAGLSSKLKHIKDRGGKIVVIDPRYTETASLASQHFFIKPGMDAYFLAGIVKILLGQNFSRGKCSPHSWSNLEELQVSFNEIALDQLANISGISIEVMEQVSSELLDAKTSICYGRMGVSTQQHGTICHWLINLINLLTGNFDQPGGVMFTHPAYDIVNLMNKAGVKGRFAKYKTRVRKLPDFDGEFPVSTLLDEIITPGDGQIKGLITVAGNPVLSVPNGTELEKAMKQLDLYVAVDFYLNETTKYADYILPPTSPLERDHYDIVFNALAIRNTVRYSQPVFAAPKGSLADWQILLELWKRLASTPAQRYQRSLIYKLAKIIKPKGLLDLGLRRGPYKLSLKKIGRQVGGVDLGPLRQSDSSRFRNSEIDLYPKDLHEGWKAFQREVQKFRSADPEDTLLIIGRRNLRSNNSWMHNCKGLKLKKDACSIFMHPNNASERNLEDGSIAVVSSSVGAIQLPVKITNKIMKGVVSIPHGWGHGRPGTKMSHAAKSPGESLNDILDHKNVEGISGNAVLNGQRVKVRRT